MWIAVAVCLVLTTSMASPIPDPPMMDAPYPWLQNEMARTAKYYELLQNLQQEMARAEYWGPYAQGNRVALAAGNEPESPSWYECNIGTSANIAACKRARELLVLLARVAGNAGGAGHGGDDGVALAAGNEPESPSWYECNTGTSANIAACKRARETELLVLLARVAGNAGGAGPDEDGDEKEMAGANELPSNKLYGPSAVSALRW